MWPICDVCTVCVSYLCTRSFQVNVHPSHLSTHHRALSTKPVRYGVARGFTQPWIELFLFNITLLISLILLYSLSSIVRLYGVLLLCIVCLGKQEGAAVKSSGLPAKSSPSPSSSYSQCPKTVHTKHTQSSAGEVKRVQVLCCVVCVLCQQPLPFGF